MRRILQSLFIFSAACAIAAAPLRAANIEWTNGSADQWFTTAGNWSAAFTSADSFRVNLSDPANFANIDAAHVMDAGELFIGNAASGKVVMAGGTMNVNTTFRIATGAFDSSLIMTDGTINKAAGGNSVRVGNNNGGTGRLTMSGNSVLSVPGSNMLFAYTTTNYSGCKAYLEMSGNAKIDSGSAAGDTYLRFGARGTAEVNMNMSLGDPGTARITHYGPFWFGDSDVAGGAGGKATLNMGGNAIVEQSNGDINVGRYADSLGTINMSGASQLIMHGWTLILGDNWYDNGTANTKGTGNMTMLGTSSYFNDTGDIRIGDQPGGYTGAVQTAQGSLTMGSAGGGDNPTVTLGGVLWIGSGGKGEMTMYGGSFSAAGGVEIGSGLQGAGGNGALTMFGGTFSSPGWISVPNGGNGANGLGSGTVTINDGLVDHSTATGPIYIGRLGGAGGLWTQNGGQTTDSWGTLLGDASRRGDMDTFSTGTLTLNGGTYATPFISSSPYQDQVQGKTGAAGVINLNGGTLEAMADSGDFVNNSAGGFGQSMTINVTKNGTSGLGAVIDTADIGGTGHVIRVNLPLQHSGAGTDGGLQKLGAGTLILNAVSSMNGPIAVDQGTLKITRTASVATKDVTVAAGAKLDVGDPPFGTLDNLNLAVGSTLGLALTPSALTPQAINLSAAATMPNSTGINYDINAEGLTLDTANPYVVIAGAAVPAGVSGAVTTNMRAYSATATVNAGVDVEISVSSTGVAAKNLFFNGAGALWDLKTTADWDSLPGPVVETFWNLDSVNFDDTYVAFGPGGKTVTLAGSLHPAAVNIVAADPTESWILEGSGGITGVGTTITLSGSGKAYLDCMGGIDPTGTVFLNGGNLLLGQNAGPVTLSGAINFNGGMIGAQGGDWDGSLTLTGALTEGAPGLGMHVRSEGGRVVLTTTANPLTGPAVFSGSGITVIPALADGGAPSTIGAASSASTNLVLSGGQIHYTGPSIAIDRSYMVTAPTGSVTSYSGIKVDNKLTLTGDVDSTGGEFWKTGLGTLTYANPTAHDNVLSSQFLVAEGPAAITDGSYRTLEWADVGTRGAKASLAMSGDAQLNVATTLAVGAFSNGVGSLAMSDDSVLTTGDWLQVGWRENFATGKLDMSGNAKITTGGAFWVGNYAWTDGSSPTGTVTMNDFAEIVVNSESFLGRWGGTGTLNVHDQATVTIHGWFGVGDNWGDDPNGVTGTGTVTIDGAGSSLDCDGAVDWTADYPALPIFGISIGVEGGNGVWNQNAGTTTNAKAVLVGDTDIWGSPKRGNGTLNLNGGTFLAPALSAGRTIAGQESQTIAAINFNGGVLKATASSTDFIGNPYNAALTVNVREGGMKFDTNGFNDTITKALNHAGTSPDGGLTKQGSGILTLTGPIGYDGATVVEAGRLSIDNGLTTTLSTVSGGGAFSVGNTNAATVVNAASITTNELTIGGGFFAAASAGSFPEAATGVPVVYHGTKYGLALGSAVPEPGTLVLLALAGLGAVLAWRRK
ncbi:MAG: autotransporter-associated beta strand repeat-containing protein [Pirellulales bacterium]|nr:autotransporter-associated beta strand repeat-containing protein [Pirellulales bacterium]